MSFRTKLRAWFRGPIGPPWSPMMALLAEIKSVSGGSGQSRRDELMPEEREQTFGEKAVGLTFNPSGEDAVATCKQGFASAIDQMNNFRNAPSTTPEAKRLASISITELQGAQMWAVKALTWRD